MPFVKLDCAILTSTIWDDSDARIVFITALLMAEPMEFPELVPQIEVRSLEETGWSAPAGWYGLVSAAGVGIVNRAGIEREAGMEALHRLGSPDPESRSPENEGRRLIRINGGYIVLNYQKYRDRDYTVADRMRRYRSRNKERNSNGVTAVTLRNVTQAEGEGEEEKEKEKEKEKSQKTPRSRSVPAFAEDSQPIKGAQFLFSKIRENNDQAREPNWQTWAKEMDILISQRKTEDIKAVIDWSQQDPFWRKNILSPKKLRQHFDQLLVSSKEPQSGRAQKIIPAERKYE